MLSRLCIQIVFCFSCLLIAFRDGASAALPVVIWHGMGATVNIGGTPELKKLIEDKLGVYVLCINTGGDDREQVYSDFFGSIADQAEAACQLIQATPELRDGYNAVGLSQGGLFLRTVIETCQHRGAQARTLITLGSPHQGVINVPVCTDLPDTSQWFQWKDIPCNLMRHFLSWGAYLPWVRTHVIQAQYFRDAEDPDRYLAKNVFLPGINNDLPVKDAQLRDNLLSLERLVLVRFDADFTVVPRDSAWFSIAQPGGLVPLNATDLYLEDFIGLRQLQTDRRLDFRSFPGSHMQYSLQEFEDVLLWPYLAGSPT